MILGLTLCYGAVKFIDLYQGNDPNIRENLIHDSFGPDDYLNFNDDLNFRLAVGNVVKGDKALIKFDPQVFKWIAVMTSKDKEGDTNKTYFNLHNCTNDDLNDFYPL